MEYSIRDARPEDLTNLRNVYRDAARHSGPDAYSIDQVAEWARFADTPEFESFILDVRTIVVETPTRIAGFGGIDDNGRIASVYVAPSYQRMGLGSLIMDNLIAFARLRGDSLLTTEASVFSKPLFEKFGFTHYDTETVRRGDVIFERYLMHLNLSGH